ncbi:MAG TPA: hypothetical protein VF516_31655 [Kofleriaceae bacterium]
MAALVRLITVLALDSAQALFAERGDVGQGGLRAVPVLGAGNCWAAKAPASDLGDALPDRARGLERTSLVITTVITTSVTRHGGSLAPGYPGDAATT